MATKKPETTKPGNNPGAFLQGERKKQNVKPLTVERQLHITTKQLENIENWNTEKLPKGVYLEGILIRYAKLLDVSEDQFKRDYSDYFKQENPPKPKQKQARRNIVLTRVLAFATVFLVAAVAVGYVVYQTTSIASRPKLEIAQPQNGATIEGQKVEVIGDTSQGSQVYVNGSQVLVSTEGRFQTDVILTPGLNDIEVRAINTFSRETTLHLKVNNIPSQQ